MTLLIFDCDGVLVDSELLANEALAELMSALGHPMTTHQALNIFSGRRLRDVLESAEALLSFPMPANLGAAAGQQLFERFRRELQPVKGVREALDMLPYPRCVASSSARERLDLSIEVTGLKGLFGDNVFSADQVEHGKPAPDLYLFAARSLGSKTRQVRRHRGFNAGHSGRRFGGDEDDRFCRRKSCDSGARSTA